MQAASEPIRSEQRGREIHFHYRFRVPVNAEMARQRLAEYLQRIGYTPAGELAWQRGSLQRSWLVWEPRTMAVRLTAQLNAQGDQTEIALHLTLDRTGHMVTSAEQETLEAELLEAARYTTQGDANFTLLERYNLRVKARAKAALWLGLAISLPACILLWIVLFPLLREWGVQSPWRGALIGGLCGAVIGGVVQRFIRSMLRTVRE